MPRKNGEDVLTAGISAGCGDDGGGSGGGTPDANTGGPADAMPAVADAALPDANPCDENAGHGSGCVDTPFALAEGGEIRLERFQTSEAGTEDLLAAQAFFFKGQTPSFRPLDGIPIELRTELAEKGIACSDFRAGNLFDNGLSTAAQAVVDTRSYYDVGDEVTLTNEDDAADVITLTEEMNTIDNSSLLNHDMIYLAPAETTIVTLGSTYLPELDGNSLDYPALDLGYGQSIAGDVLADANGDGTPKIYMPEGFTATNPSETELYAGLTATKGEDLIIEYDVANDEPADWPGVITFISFVSPANQVEFTCFNPPTEEGTFTVPYEIFEEDINVEEDSYVVMGRFVHAAWEYFQDNTRIDLIGTECKVIPQFDIVDATTGSN